MQRDRSKLKDTIIIAVISAIAILGVCAIVSVARQIAGF